MTGIEPASKAWEAFILPMNYIRRDCFQHPYYNENRRNCKVSFCLNFFLKNDNFARRIYFFSGVVLHSAGILASENLSEWMDAA